MSDNCKKCQKRLSFTERLAKVDLCGECYDAEQAELEKLSYEIAGKKLTCGHCSGDRFLRGSAQLNTSGMSFLGLEWLNKSASTFLCAKCGKIQWFLLDEVGAIKSI